jgi:hypothetical protein
MKTITPESKKMTKTEKEIIELLRMHPAIPIRTGPFGNRYKIDKRTVNGSTIERMKEKGLITIGIHPNGDRNRRGLVVADLPGKNDK